MTQQTNPDTNFGIWIFNLLTNIRTKRIFVAALLIINILKMIIPCVKTGVTAQDNGLGNMLLSAEHLISGAEEHILN